MIVAVSIIIHHHPKPHHKYPCPPPPPPSYPSPPPPPPSYPSPPPPPPSYPSPLPPSPTVPTPYPTCPKDLQLGVCANLLHDLLNIRIGQSPNRDCCSLIGGLVDLEAAVCLCATIKADILGIINLNLQLNLSLMLNHCGGKVPAGFTCA